VGLVFLLGWIEVEASLYSFPTNVELESDKIVGGLFGYHRIIE
jgi:hypothetical protein